MIKNLLWDFDGTLIDTYPAIAAAFQASINVLGADVPREQVLQLARVSLDHCTNQLSEITGLDPQAIADGFKGFYSSSPAEVSPPFPGVRELCTWAVVSGGVNVIVTHRGGRSMEALLVAHGLRSLFAGWIAHEDGFPRKPAPDAFLAIMDRYHINPIDTLALGDRDLDLEAAQAAGVGYSCAYGSGPFNIHADFVVQDFEQLLVLLRHQEV
jgi:phosphoglycolate phosphatase-like HAD superfamily hydrolase